MKENVSGCFFSEHSVLLFCCLLLHIILHHCVGRRQSVCSDDEPEMSSLALHCARATFYYFRFSVVVVVSLGSASWTASRPPKTRLWGWNWTARTRPSETVLVRRLEGLQGYGWWSTWRCMRWFVLLVLSAMDWSSTSLSGQFDPDTAKP